MISFILNLFEWPFFIRVVFGLVLSLLLWRILGKLVLWIFSIIPYVLKNIFILIYLIIKIPIVFLHKIYGTYFYKLDNMWVEVGERIHNFFERWYKKWHYNYKIKMKSAVVIAIVCYFLIVIPSYISIDIGIFQIGKNVYSSVENVLKEGIEKHFLPLELESEWLGLYEEEQSIHLTVYNLNTTLYVRDIPNKDNGIAIDKLYNGDEVIWTGEMVFVEWDDGDIKPLVKVVTENGIEGWSLLDYLYPDDYSNIEFKVEKD